ncbi:MAG TPA: NUDIX hydrolase YfcD [Morganella sp. (in: Bacteria)]|nr:NUDIX hydrolase YfcD [Morganella sp. (in: enterobacteria)]
MGQVGNSDIEWVDVVDENNDVIGQSTRDQMRAENLRHRATYIVVHDGMGKILVQRRTQSKDFYPGLLDATAGGVVQQGENMLDSARREAEEELGIAGVPFAEHGVFYYEEPVCRVWGGLFSCVTHGPFALQESEVAQVIWLTPAEITARCDEFTPDSLKALSLWLTRNNQVSYIAGDRVKPVASEPEATREMPAESIPETPVETPAAEMSSENE